MFMGLDGWMDGWVDLTVLAYKNDSAICTAAIYVFLRYATGRALDLRSTGRASNPICRRELCR